MLPVCHLLVRLLVGWLFKMHGTFGRGRERVGLVLLVFAGDRLAHHTIPDDGNLLALSVFSIVNLESFLSFSMI